jgi:protease I
MKYTGKHGYPCKSTKQVDNVAEDGADLDGLVLPGGFAPDYMRRSARMLSIISAMVAAQKPVAAICHGCVHHPAGCVCGPARLPASSQPHALCYRPWMFCSARDQAGAPVAKGVRMTSFVAVKDDVLNAGAEWVDEPVVNDRNVITSRTPDDLTPFCRAIIEAVAAGK